MLLRVMSCEPRVTCVCVWHHHLPHPRASYLQGNSRSQICRVGREGGAIFLFDSAMAAEASFEPSPTTFDRGPTVRVVIACTFDPLGLQGPLHVWLRRLTGLRSRAFVGRLRHGIGRATRSVERVGRQ